MFRIGGRLIIGGDRLREVVAREVSTVLVAENGQSQLWDKGKSNDVPFEFYYPSALVIIGLPSPTFHCMSTCLPYFSALVVREAHEAAS